MFFVDILVQGFVADGGAGIVTGSLPAICSGDYPRESFWRTEERISSRAISLNNLFSALKRAMYSSFLNAEVCIGRRPLHNNTQDIIISSSLSVALT